MKRTKAMRKAEQRRVQDDPEATHRRGIAALKAGAAGPKFALAATHTDVRMNDRPKVLPGETLLSDDYLVYHGHAYVVDGMLVLSDVAGTVRDLRRCLIGRGETAAEVRSAKLGDRIADHDRRLQEADAAARGEAK